jgi:hypothetical protein
MSSLQALGLATMVSVGMSTVLCLVIYRPLRALLRHVCPGEEAVHFWARFSVTMLFLSPLLVSIVFGLSGTQQAAGPNQGPLLQQIVSTALFGSFLSMLGMGLWVSALIRRAPRPAAGSPARPYETLAARAER